MRNVHKNRGFTLVEVVIVIGVMTIVLALSIHGFLRARIYVNDKAVANSVEAIAEATKSYIFVNNVCTSDFSDLGNATPPYLSAALVDGMHQGYNFWIIPEPSGSDSYFVYAQPEHYEVSGTKFIVYDDLTLLKFDDYAEAGSYVIQSGLYAYFPDPPTGWTGGTIGGGTCTPENCGPGHGRE